jgi:ribosome-associated heat shock protein Hsp15
MTMQTEKLRVDKYLWAIRLFKTRSEATAACEKGKVKFRDNQVKPSKQVHTGEEYDVNTEAKRWRIKVTGLLYKRVAFSESLKFYTDITPAEELERIRLLGTGSQFGKNQSKTGRPTKKDRRDLNEFFTTENTD